MALSEYGDNQVKLIVTNAPSLPRKTTMEVVMLWGSMSMAAEEGFTFIQRIMDSKLYCDTLQKTILKSIKELKRHSIFQHPQHASKITTKFL